MKITVNCHYCNKKLLRHAGIKVNNYSCDECKLLNAYRTNLLSKSPVESLRIGQYLHQLTEYVLQETGQQNIFHIQDNVWKEKEREFVRKLRSNML